MIFNGLVVNKDQKLGVMFDSPLSKTLYSSIQTAVDEAVTRVRLRQFM